MRKVFLFLLFALILSESEAQELRRETYRNLPVIVYSREGIDFMKKAGTLVFDSLFLAYYQASNKNHSKGRYVLAKNEAAYVKQENQHRDTLMLLGLEEYLSEKLERNRWDTAFLKVGVCFNKDGSAHSANIVMSVDVDKILTSAQIKDLYNKAMKLRFDFTGIQIEANEWEYYETFYDLFPEWKDSSEIKKEGDTEVPDHIFMDMFELGE